MFLDIFPTILAVFSLWLNIFFFTLQLWLLPLEFLSLFPEFIDCHQTFLCVLQPSHSYFALMCFNRLPVTYISDLILAICSRFSGRDCPVPETVFHMKPPENWIEKNIFTSFYCDVFPSAVQSSTSTWATILQHKVTCLASGPFQQILFQRPLFFSFFFFLPCGYLCFHSFSPSV